MSSIFLEVIYLFFIKIDIILEFAVWGLFGGDFISYLMV